MFRTSFYYFLAFLLISLSACEKEAITTQNEASTVQIEASVEDGMLIFPTHEAFEQAMEVVTKTSDEEMLAWVRSMGFQSLWSEFIAIENRITENSLPEHFLLEGEKERYLLEDGILTPRFSIRPIGYFVNTDFRLIIDGQLHYFDDNKHIVVADGDVLKLKKALLATESTEIEGVAITLQKDNTIHNDDLPQPRLESKLYHCGGAGYVTSVAHQKTVGKNRLRVEIRTYTWYESSGSNFEGHMRAYLNIRNLRKSGFIWKHTAKPTIVNATSGSVAWTMAVYPPPYTITYNYNGVSNSSPQNISWYDEILVEGDGRTSNSQYNNQYSQFLSGRGRGTRTDITSLDIEVGCH